jgi:HAMP domain-containing protein
MYNVRIPALLLLRMLAMAAGLLTWRWVSAASSAENPDAEQQPQP